MATLSGALLSVALLLEGGLAFVDGAAFEAGAGLAVDGDSFLAVAVDEVVFEAIEGLVLTGFWVGFAAGG